MSRGLFVNPPTLVLDYTQHPRIFDLKRGFQTEWATNGLRSEVEDWLNHFCGKFDRLAKYDSDEHLWYERPEYNAMQTTTWQFFFTKPSDATLFKLTWGGL